MSLDLKIPSSAVTEEEIRLLVAESHEAGVIDDYERNMMNRVMRLGDRTADSPNDTTQSDCLAG